MNNNAINEIILASASARRYELLKPHFSKITVAVPNCEESYTASVPVQIAEQIARKKLDCVRTLYPMSHCPIIAADTIVWLEGKVYGKPFDEKHAYNMLSALSGKVHQVYTAYAIFYNGKVSVDFVRSDVSVKHLSDADIRNYIASGSPMDKAGAYGIQDNVIVSSYDGSYDNIVGLPVAHVLDAIDRLN